jgi:glycosyltransferase involved in cell wall biosynthesis|tara:strand:+ start:7146 stop:8240 length:1095 start_codon:yes stop_codon:yes gene_type:complete
MKTKLLIFIPSIEGGGVEKNLFIITNFLSKKITNIYLITSSKQERGKFKNIKIISPKLNLKKESRKVRYLFCLYEIFKFYIFNKNTLTFSFQANIYCILISKLFGRKIIVRSNSSPTGWSKNFLKKFFFKKILSLADTVIVNSVDFKKEFKRKFNINSVKIFNPLNKTEIKKLSNTKIQIPFFDKANKSLKIINIGRLTDQKDQITLLKSINKIAKIIDLRLIILGRGIYYKVLKSFIKKNNLSKFVKIINFKKNPYKYIRKSDLFILTSKYEGLPNVLLEAMTLKKFIISTNCPTGPKEILQNGRYGSLCKVGDFNKVAKEIIKFNANRKRYNKVCNQAYKSLDRFDYKNNLNKYFTEIKKFI